MLRKGLNIFSDYVHNDVMIFDCKKLVNSHTEGLNNIEKKFTADVNIKQIMDRNRQISVLEDAKEVLSKLEMEKTSLEQEIKAFFKKFPQTKRVSLRGDTEEIENSVGAIPKEWFVIDLYNNEQVRIQSVKG